MTCKHKRLAWALRWRSSASRVAESVPSPRRRLAQPRVWLTGKHWEIVHLSSPNTHKHHFEDGLFHTLGSVLTVLLESSQPQPPSEVSRRLTKTVKLETSVA